jgi:hypothetical protein
VQDALQRQSPETLVISRNRRTFVGAATRFRPLAFLPYEHMFWRHKNTSTGGAVRRALDQARASLLLDTPPYDWASETDWPHGFDESRALQPSAVAATARHRHASRPEHARTRGGAVPERPHYCLCPTGHRQPPLVRSRPSRCALDKRAVGR